MTTHPSADVTTHPTHPCTTHRGPAPRPLTYLLAAIVHLQSAWMASAATAGHRRCRGDRAQATTEYALILLAAALVGLMVVAWATAGGGAARISRLFNNVIDAVIDRV